MSFAVPLAFCMTIPGSGRPKAAAHENTYGAINSSDLDEEQRIRRGDSVFGIPFSFAGAEEAAAV